MQSITRRWHRLIEHYTPDGALGRVLLAVVSGSVSGGALFATLFSNAGPSLFLFFLFPLWAGLCLGAAVLTVVTLLNRSTNGVSTPSSPPTVSRGTNGRLDETPKTVSATRS